MIINATGKFVGPLFLVLQESKGKFGPIVMQKLTKIAKPNFFPRFSTPVKSIEQLTGKYLDKIHECAGGAASILVVDKWSGRTDEGICIEKFDFNMAPVFLPVGMTKYLQLLDVKFFQDYKYLVKMKRNIPKLIETTLRRKS